MKKRSRLRKRIRDWLNKRKKQKEENPLPSFTNPLDESAPGKIESDKGFLKN